MGDHDEAQLVLSGPPDSSRRTSNPLRWKWDATLTRVLWTWDNDGGNNSDVQVCVQSHEDQQGEAVVSPRNERSLRLVRRLGFPRRGRCEKHDGHNCKVTDDFLFSLLNRDWGDDPR